MTTTAVKTPSAPETDWTALNSLAQNVGRNVARNWPGIDPEDCAQEALTALLERPKVIEVHGDNEAFLRSFMTRVATQYASGERYHYTVMSSDYLYTPKEVRGLLDNAFWDDSVRESSVPAGPDSKTQLLVWENVCVALWDLDSAFERLTGTDQFRLKRRFKDGEEFPTDAARKACDRAIDTLTQRLNERVNRAEEV